MKIIICLDNENGMMFHGRRLSQDRLLRKDILKELGNGKLWMNEYSAKMFADDQNENIMVSEEFSSQAGNQEFCFVDNVPAVCDRSTDRAADYLPVESQLSI